MTIKNPKSILVSSVPKIKQTQLKTYQTQGTNTHGNLINKCNNDKDLREDCTYMEKKPVAIRNVKNTTVKIMNR